MPVDTKIETVDIEAKLKELWDREHGQNRTRAAFFTLIIYSTKTDVEELMQSVISKFPCRVIWIIEEKNKGDYLKTDVRTQAVSENVFCEIIEIIGSGRVVERIPFLVLPHILADLPLYLLWTKEAKADDPMITFFAPFAKKIILDAKEIGNINTYFKNTQLLAKKFPDKISDLSWNALKSWRQFIFSIFDTEEAFNALQNCNEISITYNHSETDQPINIIYFQGWLTHLFAWRFQKIESDKQQTRLLYKGLRHESTVTLIPGFEPNFRPNGLISIEIEGATENTHFRFKRNCETSQIFYQFSDKNFCELPKCQHLTGVPEGEELIEEIFFQTENTLYRKILERVAEISWAIE